MNDVIVGVDQSDTARRAAKAAAGHAIANRANLHIVTCTQRGRAHLIDVGGDEWHLDPLADSRAFVQDLAQSLNVPDVTTTVSYDDPATALCNEAHRLDAQLVVVGNRRVQGLSRMLGGIASAVLKKAPCDVLIANTVKPDDRPRPASRRWVAWNTRSGVPVRITEALGGDFTAEELRALARFGTLIEVDEGRSLIVDDRKGNEAFVVVSGSADVTCDDEVIATISVGSIFGEGALTDSEPPDAVVTARSKLAVFVMTPAGFSSLLMACPRLDRIIRVVAARRGTPPTRNPLDP